MLVILPDEPKNAPPNKPDWKIYQTENLCQIALNTANERVRSYVAYEIAQRRDAQSIQRLAAGLSDDDAAVRLNAVKALWVVSKAGDASLATQALEDLLIRLTAPGLRVSSDRDTVELVGSTLEEIAKKPSAIPAPTYAIVAERPAQSRRAATLTNG